MLSASALVESSAAQSTTSAATQETGVVFTKLATPVYPPLARQAQIGGDVELELSIRQDGTVASATAISGHPMLKEAALASVQKSQFLCRDCGNPGAEYSVTYTFTPGQHLGVCSDASYSLMQEDKSELSVAQGHVTIVGGPMCGIVDNITVSRKTRAAKCLYLWKCGFRQVEQK